jgi:type IX secretion system PorP/SprF family membrane protein
MRKTVGSWQLEVDGKGKRLSLLACSLLFALCSFSQDVHYTQFFTNPLILNPAQTGYYDGNYRIGFNFKAQWPWATSQSIYNYHTEAPYVDFSFGEKKIKVGWFGLGFNFLNDQAGDGQLSYRRFSTSIAYHQAFDKDHRYILSLGFGASYVLRSVDFSKFYFNNQWVDDEGFNLSIDPAEPWKKQSFGLFDMNAGLNFGAQISDMVRLDVGFSMLHLNRPKHSFYNQNERLGLRYQASAGTGLKINERMTLDVNAYYTYQKKASEILFGALYGYGLYDGKRSHNLAHMLYVGMYYRVKDALTPVVGYRFKTMRLLLSYDVTLSKLATAAKANGGPEISLVYVGKWNREFNGKKVYCPRF